MNFVNRGSDYNCMKSMSKQGLVQKEVQVQGKHGTYVRKQWVSSGRNEESEHHRTYHDSHPNKPKTMYFPLVDSSLTSSRVFSYSDIMMFYSKNKDKIRVPIQTFVKDNYYVSDGKNQTQSIYKTSQGYTRQRQKLHDTIIKGILDSANSPAKGQKPLAVLMGGGTASGKGTLRNSFIVPRLQSMGIKVGISDCDDIKNQLPEYKHFQQQDSESAALRVHEESMDIAIEAMDSLVKHNKNLIFDGTMKDVNKYSKMIDKLHKAGYQVQIVGADIPVNVAIMRSNKRAQQTKRQVPEGIIYGSHGGFATTYPQLLDKVDGYSLYDNSGSEPVLIQDERKTYRPDLLDKFHQKGEQFKVQKTIQNISRTYQIPRKEIQELYDNGASLEEIQEYFELGLED